MKFRKKQADMGSRLQKALVMEQKAQQILLELKDEIICDIKAAGPIPGVEIPDSSVTCAIVNISALHRHSLNPSTYIPAVQADAVKRKLAPKQTVHGVLESLNEMIEKQSVQFPDKEQVLLNSNTIAALVPWKCSLPEQRA